MVSCSVSCCASPANKRHEPTQRQTVHRSLQATATYRSGRAVAAAVTPPASIPSIGVKFSQVISADGFQTEEWSLCHFGLPGASAERALTRQIAQCLDLKQLAALCLKQQARLNPIHISAALTVCSRRLQQQRHDAPGCRLQQQLSTLVCLLLKLLLAQVHQCTGRELSTALWCLAKLQHPTDPCTVQQLVAQYVDVVHSSSGQSTATVLCALASMQPQPGLISLDSLLHSLVKHYTVTGLRQQSTSQLADRAGAISPWGDPCQPDPRGLCGTQHQAQQRQQHQQQQPVQAPESQAARLWALAQSAWALAKLQHPALARTWLLPLLSLLLDSCGSSSTTRHAPSHVQLQAAAPGTHVLCCSSTAAAASVGPAGSKACAVALWACATIAGGGCAVPSKQWPTKHQQRRLEAFRRAVTQQAVLLLRVCEQHLLGLQPQSACMLLWSVNRLRVAPRQSWCQHFYTAALHISGQLSSSQCAALLCGMAYLPVRPPAALCAACLAGLGRQLHSLPASQLSQVLRACGRLRVRPPAAWVQALLEAFLAPHQQHDPTTLATLMHALSRVGFKPSPAAAAALQSHVERHMHNFRPHNVSKLLQGCAVLQLHLPAVVHEALLQSYMHQLQAASPSDTVLMLRALTAHCRQHQQQQPPCSPWRMTSALDTDGCWDPASLGCASTQQQQQQQQGLGGRTGWAADSLTASNSLPLLHQWHVCGRVSSSACSHLANVHSRGDLDQWHSMQRDVFVPLAAAVDRLFRSSRDRMHCLQAAELCHCVWAAAWLRPHIGVAWAQALNTRLAQSVQGLAAGDMCLLLWSLARLRGSWPAAPCLLKQLLLRSQVLMQAGSFTARDLTSFVWGYRQVTAGQCRRMPPAWVVVFGQALGRQLHTFTTRQLGVALRACVVLNVALGLELLQQVSCFVDVRSAQLDAAQLGSLTKSLAALQQLHQHTALHGAGSVAASSSAYAAADAMHPADLTCNAGIHPSQSTCHMLPRQPANAEGTVFRALAAVV